MLEMLHLKNVGPAKEMKLEFGSRLNVITGDNGLGKSFILDCAWQMLTSREAIKVFPKDFTIPVKMEATIRPENNLEKSTVDGIYLRGTQKWNISKKPVLLDLSIVIYQNIENHFLICDRLSESQNEQSEVKERYFKFTPDIVWDGDPSPKPTTNGLIRDVATWKLKGGTEIEILRRVLHTLSPDEHSPFELGALWNFDLDDSREFPTVVVNGESIPVTQVSSGVKKILMFAYVLVWTYLEHLRAAKATNFAPTKHIILLIDEIEQHLHPRWQRTIVAALIQAVKEIMSLEVKVQIITTTHSPLVMASLEPFFDPKTDAWFDLNLVNNQVTLEKMNFVRRGGAEMWLLSDAFDLQSTGSMQREQAIDEAARAIENPKLTKKKFLELDKKLRTSLPETDEYWLNWRFYGEKKGWL